MGRTRWVSAHEMLAGREIFVTQVFHPPGLPGRFADAQGQAGSEMQV